MWPMCMLILEYLKNYVETKRQSNARHCPPHQDSTCVKFMQQWKSQCRSNHPRRWQYGTEEHWIHHRGRCAGAIKWTPRAPVDEKPWGLEVTISGFFFLRTITSKHPERTKMGKFMAKIKRSGIDVSVLFISLTFQSWESLHLWPRLIWPAHQSWAAELPVSFFCLFFKVSKWMDPLRLPTDNQGGATAVPNRIPIGFLTSNQIICMHGWIDGWMDVGR